MEQFEFSFSPKESAEAANDSQKENLEALSDAELADRYNKAVGVNPTPRGFDRTTLLAGLASPEEEYQRILEIDRASDKEDLRKTHTR